MVSNEKPKILLYYPSTYPPPKLTGRAPLSLIAISTFLVKEGFDVVIVGDNLYSEPIKKVLSEAPNALCLGITSLTGYQITDGLKIARQVKELYPNLPIIWGGWHPTLNPEGTLRSPYVDIVVRGQGEMTFTELVHTLAEAGDVSNVLGVSYKKDGAIRHNPDRPLEDINNFPPYPYYLIDVEKTLFPKPGIGERAINYVSSFGCPWHCTFCAVQRVHMRRWLAFSPYRMADEIEALVKNFNIDTIDLDDGEFFISKERVRIFCEEILRRGLRVNFSNANGRIRQLLHWEDEMWQLIVRAGFKEILVGAESGYQPALDLMEKDLLVEETLAFAEKAKQYNLKVFYSMFCGLPWGPNSKDGQRVVDIEIKHTVELATKLIKINPKNRVVLFIYTPYPGTPLFDRSVELGLKAPSQLEEWGNWVVTLKNTPWVTVNQAKKVAMLRDYVFPVLDADSRELALSSSANRLVRFWMQKALNIFRVSAGFRLRHQFFAFPLDFWLYSLGIRFSGIQSSTSRQRPDN